MFDSRLLDAAGFLVNSTLSTPLKSLFQIAEAGNAILVAEGGMGKTFVLNEFKASFPDAEVEKLELAFYSGYAQGLMEAIERARDKKYLLIDGIDEAPELCSTLLLSLTHTTLPGHVILASRSIPQLNPVCETLKWPLFSLLPYTREDVRELCEAEGKDFSAFMREVEGHGLGGVCAKPLGCDMLLASFTGEHLAYSSSEDLWRNAIFRLCSENTGSRTRALMNDSGVTPDQCWNIAIRMALILKLAGQSTIERISSSSGLENNTVDFSKIIPADEHSKFNECLLRPLFSPIGHEHFRFSHSSYFDFMAAMGLIEYVKPSEWRKIVFSPDGLPYPQWEGTVPWLAARNGQLLEQIKKSRPDLLLGSDAVVNQAGAEAICRSILENAENIPSDIRNNPSIQARYYALATGGCIRELSKTLRDSQSYAEIDTAIDIVRQTRLVQMGDPLAEFFCDPSKDESLRISAGYVLRDLANDNQREKCRALLSKAMSTRLKGIALALLWPKHMTAAELIPLLEPNADGMFDSYDWWLNHEFPLSFGQLPEMELETLLKWTIANLRYPGNAEERNFLGLKLRILRHCWEKTSSRPTRELLAEGLETCAKIHLDPFGDHWLHGPNIYGWHEFIADVARRRDMARLIVGDETRSLAPLTHPYIGLLQYGDIDFILSEIKSSDRAGRRERWAQCLASLAGAIQLPEQNELWNWLHGEFPQIFNVDAQTALAERKKVDAQIQVHKQDWQQKEADRKLKRAETREKQTAWIHEQLHKGVGSCPFDKVMFLILCQPQDDKSSFCHDFRQSKLWKTFSQQEIAVLTEGAYQFVLSCNGPWADEKGYYPSYVQAFCLLAAYAKERLASLPPGVWRKFVPDLWREIGYGATDLLTAAWKCLLENQPEVFVEELAKRLGDQLAKNQMVEVYAFKEIIDAKTAKRLLATLDTRELTDEQRRKLYDGFWHIDEQTTAEHVNSSWVSNSSIDKCGVLTSLYLVLSAPQKRFPELLQLLARNPQWGRGWITQMLGEGGYHHCPFSSILCHLSVTELKEFYGWLLSNFPPENAPHHTGCYSPDQMDNVYESITRVYNEMVSRVDPELPKALEDLSKKFPRLVYFHDAILQARRNLLERGCPTYDLGTIKRLLKTDKQAVIIHTPDDLLSVICETLERYQVYLTGKEAPQIDSLWNTGHEAVSHKNETSFSNHIKKYMDLVLPNIVSNLEVKLNSGARTDIWVTAFSKATGAQLRLCIEVKGSWNRSCRSAFKDQLCEKYMGAGGAEAGIFLVGWFFSKKAKKNCNQWKDMGSARRFLQEQEADCCKRGFKVRSIVVDCTY